MSRPARRITGARSIERLPDAGTCLRLSSVLATSLRLWVRRPRGAVRGGSPRIGRLHRRASHRTRSAAAKCSGKMRGVNESQQLWALCVGDHLRIFGRIRCECSVRICGPHDAVTRSRPNPYMISADAHLRWEEVRGFSAKRPRGPNPHIRSAGFGPQNTGSKPCTPPLSFEHKAPLNVQAP